MQRNKMNCLEKADRIVKSRNKIYGDPIESFGQVATIASILLKKKIESIDIVIIMKIIKMVRESNGNNPDNLIDEAGYLRIQEIILERNVLR